MRQIRWTTEASDQLEDALKHIQQDNPTAALNVAKAVTGRIEQLASFPGLGRPGEVKGTRELVCPPYVAVYRSNEEIVESCTSGTGRKTGAEIGAGNDTECEVADRVIGGTGGEGTGFAQTPQIERLPVRCKIERLCVPSIPTTGE